MASDTEFLYCPVNVALYRFNETSQDDESTDLPRPILEALCAFKFMTKHRAGRYGFSYQLTELGEARIEAIEAAMTGQRGNE